MEQKVGKEGWSYSVFCVGSIIISIIALLCALSRANWEGMDASNKIMFFVMVIGLPILMEILTLVFVRVRKGKGLGVLTVITAGLAGFAQSLGIIYMGVLIGLDRLNHELIYQNANSTLLATIVIVAVWTIFHAVWAYKTKGR